MSERKSLPEGGRARPYPSTIGGALPVEMIRHEAALVLPVLLGSTRAVRQAPPPRSSSYTAARIAIRSCIDGLERQSVQVGQANRPMLNRFPITFALCSNGICFRPPPAG